MLSRLVHFSSAYLYPVSREASLVLPGRVRRGSGRATFALEYRQCWFLLAFAIWTSVSGFTAADENERFFESRIRPILAEHCLECHGPTKQSGELRLDSRDHLIKGGESGPVLSPGNPNASRIIQAVRRSDDLAMPPDETLAPEHFAGGCSA